MKTLFNNCQFILSIIGNFFTNRLSCIILILFLPFFVRGQSYYPGGLGNTNLKLWLDGADQATILNAGGSPAGNGNAIAKWTDKSGSANHAVQASGTAQPFDQTNSQNGLAGVIFQNSNQFLTGPTSSYQTIVSVRSLLGPDHYQTLFSSPANGDFSIRGGGATTTYTDGPNANDWCYNTGSTPALWVNGFQGLNPTPGAHVLVSSAAAAVNSTYSLSSTYNSRGMAGNDPVYELLSYNVTLSNTQRIILENYEAAKWGLVSTLPTSSYPVFTPPTLTSYTTNLVGIGYNSAGDNFLSNSASFTDGLGFSSGTSGSDFLNTTGYVMAAHNNQANTIQSNTTIAGIGSGLSLWNRSWNVQTMDGNASGNITFNFNFSSYNGSAIPGAGYNYYLLYNATDGSFASGTNKVVGVNSSITGNTATITVNKSILANGYYTIMWPTPGAQLITPSSNILCAGNNTVFTTVTSSGFTYQWQVNTGSGFANIPVTDPGGAAYNGATTASLSITGTTVSMSGYTYQCILTPSSGSPVTLGPGSLTVNAAPVVAPITGTTSLFAGSATTLADATAGGVWTSSNTGVASINSSTGQVAALTYGSTTITYTVTNASNCPASVTSTVSVIVSHYFPAGIGNTNLKVWLDAADAGSILTTSGNKAVNGDNVGKWLDKSGNSNHAYQNFTGTQPVNQTNQLNGNAGIFFQNTGQYMKSTTTASYQTIVAVRSLPGTSNFQTLFAAPANTDFSVRGGGASGPYAGGSGSPNGNDWPYNTGTSPTEWLNGNQSMTGSNANHIIVSASASAVSGTYSISTTFQSRGMNGNDPVYELLAYNNTLNTTQRHLVENYKAAKWGLTNLLPVAGYTIFTPPSTTTYNKNLVGIGYTSSSDNFLTNPTNAPNGSTDGLGFSSGTGASDLLNSAGYLMAAHNGQAATILNNITLSNISSGSGSLGRWNRSWWLQKTGGNPTGVTTLNFNFPDYNFGNVPSTSYVYGILYNATDGTFASGTNQLLATTSTTVTTTNIAFGVKAGNLANGYYTLVWSTAGILKVIQESFTVIAKGETSLLNWRSSQDMKSGRFEIERRIGAGGFETIGIVTGTTTTSISESYAYIDSKPAAGVNEYRLKIIFYDGSTTYSDIRTIVFNAGTATTLFLHPNPVSDILMMKLTNLPLPASVRIITITGVVVKSLSVTQNGETSIIFSDLPAGIYMLETIAKGYQSVQKIIKR